jgi:aspartate kinase
VSVGELLSSKLLECFLVKNNINCILLDARNVIKTDDNYSDVAILWDETSNKINEFVLSQTENNKIILTQGFIGSTMQGNTTTLGREGSDYSASIFSFCLNAKKITIWKDVDGVMNADPKQFQHTVLIPKISYREAIEMTYYGAKVIHPKTIKPLQNKSIPLHVKSFLAPHNQGSIVCDFSEYISYPPVSVLKNNQTLISIQTRDFSFISEKHLQKIFENFAIHRIKINMMQNGAISFSCCVDWSTQLNTAITDLQFSFKVLINSNLQLITIRHYNEQTIHELTYDKEILLEQKTRQTIQFVLK